MSTTAANIGPPNSSERRPLLESRIGSSYVDVPPDPEAALSANEPEEVKVVAKRVDYWRVIWYLVFAAFGGVLLAGIIKGFVENGDVEAITVNCCLADRPSLT